MQVVVLTEHPQGTRSPARPRYDVVQPLCPREPVSGPRPSTPIYHRTPPGVPDSLQTAFRRAQAHHRTGRLLRGIRSRPAPENPVSCRPSLLTASSSRRGTFCKRDLPPSFRAVGGRRPAAAKPVGSAWWPPPRNAHRAPGFDESEPTPTAEQVAPFRCAGRFAAERAKFPPARTGTCFAIPCPRHLLPVQELRGTVFGRSRNVPPRRGGRPTAHEQHRPTESQVFRQSPMRIRITPKRRELSLSRRPIRWGVPPPVTQAGPRPPNEPARRGTRVQPARTPPARLGGAGCPPADDVLEDCKPNIPRRFRG